MYKRDNVLSVYFGVPGAGKTTLCAWLTRKDLKRGLRVFSNVPIIGAFRMDPKEDIGIWDMSDSRIIIDEASIDYNNRNFKSLGQHAIKFFKLHRHYHTAIDVFSQSYDDMDITLRRLARRLYVVKPGILPWFIHIKRITKKIDVDERTKQIIDAYDFVPFATRIIFSPPLWKMFDSWSAPYLPYKQFDVYNSAEVSEANT